MTRMGDSVYYVMKDGQILSSDDGFAVTYNALNDMSSASTKQDLFKFDSNKSRVEYLTDTSSRHHDIRVIRDDSAFPIQDDGHEDEVLHHHRRAGQRQKRPQATTYKSQIRRRCMDEVSLRLRLRHVQLDVVVPRVWL